MLPISDASEVFVHAFSQVKSRTYSYVPMQVGNLWIMRVDSPRKRERKIEIIAHGASPTDIVKAVQETGVGRHFLCIMQGVNEDFQSIRKGYKNLSYRAVSTDWFFVHDLRDIPIFECNPPVRPVPDAETFEQLNQVASKPFHFSTNTLYFAIWDETQYYGHVRSIPYKESAWVSDLYVECVNRGKGFGRALMRSLLQSDKEKGVKQSVLLASNDGALLYPHMGYQQIGILQMFCPTIRPSV